MVNARSACSACRERGGKQEAMESMGLLNDGGAAGGGSDVEMNKGDQAGTWADVYALPPLPDQDLCAMRGEACCGNFLVCFLIFLFVAPMQAFAMQTTTPLTPLMKLWIGAIWAEAATAITCLIGLMWGDPGTIKRSPATSFPMPELVAERLRNGRTLDGVGNVHEVGANARAARTPSTLPPRPLHPRGGGGSGGVPWRRVLLSTWDLFLFGRTGRCIASDAWCGAPTTRRRTTARRASGACATSTTTAASSAGASPARAAAATWATSRCSS